MIHHARLTGFVRADCGNRANRARRVRMIGAALAVAAALSSAACSSGGTDNATSSATSTSSVAQSHNAADVTFSQDMIPHHRQAIEMAMLAPSRASDPRVIELAAQIEAAQKPEIDELTARLRSWGESVPTGADAGHSGMDHGSMNGSSMNGMMSASDLAELTGVRGAEFDRQWLSMMIEHHTGAVAMARDEIANGKDASSKALAQNIMSTQQAEIARMRAILAG